MDYMLGYITLTIRTCPSMIQVLLADGHKIARETLAFTFQAIGEIQVAGNVDTGDEAIKICQETDVDVVILTVTIPTLDSIDVAKMIRQNCPSTGIILLTAYPGISQQMLDDAGIDGCLTKNSGLKELISKLHALAKQRRR